MTVPEQALSVSSLVFYFNKLGCDFFYSGTVFSRPGFYGFVSVGVTPQNIQKFDP